MFLALCRYIHSLSIPSFVSQLSASESFQEPFNSLDDLCIPSYFSNLHLFLINHGLSPSLSLVLLLHCALLSHPISSCTVHTHDREHIESSTHPRSFGHQYQAHHTYLSRTFSIRVKLYLFPEQHSIDFWLSLYFYHKYLFTFPSTTNINLGIFYKQHFYHFDNLTLGCPIAVSSGLFGRHYFYRLQYSAHLIYSIMDVYQWIYIKLHNLLIFHIRDHLIRCAIDVDVGIFTRHTFNNS